MHSVIDGPLTSSRDFCFPKVHVTRYSSLGTPYTKAIEVGMPKLPRRMLDTVFYLYKNKADALKGSDIGGTGFFLAMRSKQFPDRITYIYGVTNWHVAVKRGYSVIRINTTDGPPEILEYGPEDWEFIPDGSDVAAVELPQLSSQKHNFAYVTDNFLFPESHAEEVLQLGPGDDVFMIGRFVDYNSGPTNTPFVRFGNISSIPVPIKQPTGSWEKSYCVDMHSRSGYSGSPVFFYRSSINNLDFMMGGAPPETLRSDCALLGINWGQFPEYYELIPGKELPDTEVGLEIMADRIKGYSGITCVVPCWRIAELLNIEKWVKARNETDMKHQATIAQLPIEESALDPTGGDDILRATLKTPPIQQA
jgi:hypothetical protein